MKSVLHDRLTLGQNNFELIEFSLTRHLDDGTIHKGLYGVNVAKVREVVRMPKINKLSSRVDGVAGVFELRGIPIPAINLAKALGDKNAPIADTQQIIVTEFSRKRAGFIVSSTHRIRRIAWEKVLPPAADSGTCINGMTLIENNEFLFILDLEKILLDIEGKSRASSVNMSAQQHLFQQFADFSNINRMPAPQSTGSKSGAPRGRGRILLVDDSSVILTSCRKALEAIGYTVEVAKDGGAAREILESAGKKSPGKPPFDVLVSDVEMPRMDGLTLTKWIRENSKFTSLPIILHTSLSSAANQAAGMSVGANGYVIKNDIKALAELLVEIIGDPSAPLASA
jgi:two-component system chemotaxis response regulator CheV